MHAHMFIQVEHHNKQLHLDYYKMKETIMKELGLKNIYFQSKLIRGQYIKNLENYIDKTFS
jgi:hypothetical protein